MKFLLSIFVIITIEVLTAKQYHDNPCELALNDSYVRNFKCFKRHCSKLRLTKSRTLYYANSTSTLRLILSGDIELNPGPLKQKKSPTCPMCLKTVRSNSKKVECSVCHDRVHLKCVSSKSKQTINDWICTSCLHTVLPFFNQIDLDTSVQSTSSQDSEHINQHLDILKQHKCHTSIAHINVQSLLSTFDAFSLMMNTYNFDIVALSETWLKESHHLQNYVQINGYNATFKNRENKKGGGVGLYIKDHLKYTVRHDLSKIDETLEILWVEIRGRNKNNSYLVGSIYQPSSNETEKRQWLERFDRLITEIYVKWNGIIILAGDFNIDLLNVKESTRMYKDLLHTFSFHQHVHKPMRKNKTLIDHISSNLAHKIIHSDVIYTDEISDHDMPYIIVNIKKDRFEPRYKFIRNQKNLIMSNYIEEFKQLPFNLIHAFSDPEDQIGILNKLILDCIQNHAPMRRVKITRPTAPWMNDINIRKEKEQLEGKRKKALDTQNENDRKLYQDARNSLKKSITNTKFSFYRKAMS